MDHTNFKDAKSNDNGSHNNFAGGTQREWWKLKDDEIPMSVAQTVQFLLQHQGARHTQMHISARLYGNLTLMGLNGLSYSKIASVQSSLKDRISYNVVQSAIDTITAKIAKNKPKPLFLTSGGDYKMQRKAKKLNKFCEGIFYENDAYDLGVAIFRDAAVWGTGIVHVFEENKTVKYERVIPSEIYVDEIEGFYGEPRQLHRVKNIDRNVMIDAFPDFKKELLEVNAARPDDTGKAQQVSDLVTVCESWHLASGENAEDGKHVITCGTTTLLNEEWRLPTFPFAFFHWSKRLYGFWGQGLAEQIQNIQLEINKILWVIQRSMHLAGSFKILMENSSKIVKEHLNNDIGSIITYTTTPPQYVTPPVVAPEVYSHLATLKQDAFMIAGVSMLSAGSQKPAGLNSGKALREYNDIESDRFQTIGKAYENLFLDIAKLSVAVAKDIRGYEVKYPNKKNIEFIKWSDINLKADDYFMQCYPVSSLPNDPAGRLQTVQEYIQAGFLDPRQGQRLLDFPDLDAIESLSSAAEDYLHEVFERMVEDGEYSPPGPLDDLKLAKTMAVQYYQQGKLNGLEPEKIELITRYLEQVDTLVQMANPPPPPVIPAANPMSTPTSDMIPNTNTPSAPMPAPAM
jgi:hypothetical protein